MSFDYQQALFHVGVRVPDLEAAMAALGGGLGLTWAQVVGAGPGAVDARARAAHRPASLHLLVRRPAARRAAAGRDRVDVGRRRPARRAPPWACGSTTSGPRSSVSLRRGGRSRRRRRSPENGYGVDGVRPLARRLPARTRRQRPCARGSTGGGPADRSTERRVGRSRVASSPGFEAMATQKLAETIAHPVARIIRKSRFCDRNVVVDLDCPAGDRPPLVAAFVVVVPCGGDPEPLAVGGLQHAVKIDESGR